MLPRISRRASFDAIGGKLRTSGTGADCSGLRSGMKAADMSPLPTFRRRFLDALPGDTRTDTASRAVVGAAWSRVIPTPVAAPRLLAWSRPLAAELGLDDARMDDPATAQVLGGNSLWPGMHPFA